MILTHNKVGNLRKLRFLLSGFCCLLLKEPGRRHEGALSSEFCSAIDREGGTVVGAVGVGDGDEGDVGEGVVVVGTPTAGLLGTLVLFCSLMGIRWSVREFTRFFFSVNIKNVL